MKIFFFSSVFAPSVGGIQRLTDLLCREFATMGHEVRVATLTPGDGDNNNRLFPVERRPSIPQFLRLLNWCDVHIQANVSLRYVLPWLIRPCRFIYSHHDLYRGDGPLASLELAKRLIARCTPGIANSRFTAAKLGCARVVLNAYDDVTFSTAVPWETRDCGLVFVGRLVSLKGCDVLLRALGYLKRRGLTPEATIIGDGPDREMLEALAGEECIDDQVRFTGTLQGHDLATELNRHRIIAIPSLVEETFGIVALEGLACGCLPIVSERGGLVEAIGGHGFAFPNGDVLALAECIERVLRGPDTARACLENAETHLLECCARTVAARYVAVFNSLLQ